MVPIKILEGNVWALAASSTFSNEWTTNLFLSIGGYPHTPFYTSSYPVLTGP